MPPKHDMISEVSPKADSWNLLVRVVRLWTISDFKEGNLPLFLEMVFIDDQGDKIGASIRKTFIYLFQSKLIEGAVYLITNLGVATNVGEYRSTRHKYRLNFKYETKVFLQSDNLLPKDVFSFTPPEDFFRIEYDTNYLVDVIGILIAVGTEKEFKQMDGTKSKINIMELNTDGYRFKCTLFGSYVDELNSSLSAGDIHNAVVAILCAKVKKWQGKHVLQNAKGCSKLLFNHESSEFLDLRRRMNQNNDSPCQGISQLPDSRKISLLDDFLSVTPRSTIQALKDFKEVGSFIVLATITLIVDQGGWWYSACVCNKKVIKEEEMFFCEKCNRHVFNVTPRYRIKVRVIDDTDCTTFVIFDGEATLLLDKSCADLVESTTTSSMSQHIPPVIEKWVDQSFLFKVGVNQEFDPRFERSFRVQRVTNDPEIINKFKDTNIHEENAYANGLIHGKKAGLPHDEESVVIAEDLIKKFTDTVEDNEKEIQVAEYIDLSNDKDDSIPLKRASPDDHSIGASSAPAKLLKREIKKEKD